MSSIFKLEKDKKKRPAAPQKVFEVLEISEIVWRENSQQAKLPYFIESHILSGCGIFLYLIFLKNPYNNLYYNVTH